MALPSVLFFAPCATTFYAGRAILATFSRLKSWRSRPWVMFANIDDDYIMELVDGAEAVGESGNNPYMPVK